MSVQIRGSRAPTDKVGVPGWLKWVSRSGLAYVVPEWPRLRQRLGGVGDRAIQDRGHPSPGSVEAVGGRGVRHLGMGRLVQPAKAPGTLGAPSTGRVRGPPSSASGGSGRSGLTHSNRPPENPGRFNSMLGAAGQTPGPDTVGDSGYLTPQCTNATKLADGKATSQRPTALAPDVR